MSFYKNVNCDMFEKMRSICTVAHHCSFQAESENNWRIESRYVGNIKMYFNPHFLLKWICVHSINIFEMNRIIINIEADYDDKTYLSRKIHFYMYNSDDSGTQVTYDYILNEINK